MLSTSLAIKALVRAARQREMKTELFISTGPCLLTQRSLGAPLFLIKVAVAIPQNSYAFRRACAVLLHIFISLVLYCFKEQNQKPPYTANYAVYGGFGFSFYFFECGANNDTILAVSSLVVNLDGMNLPL